MELKVPPAGESISTVMISEWLVAEGDPVTADQTLVILETDKINVEVPAPVSGTMGKILKGPGQEADIGEVIAQIAEGASSSPPAEKKAEPAAKAQASESSEPAEPVES